MYITLKDFLNESKKQKDVLFEDEQGRNIVFDSKDYRISVDSPKNAKHIVLWYNKDNKWSKVGALTASGTDKRFEWDNDIMDYLKINEVEINKEHQGKGFGTKLYQTLFDFCDKQYKGLMSYLPDRVNKNQVPSIYKKFKTKTQGDYHVILF